MRRFAFLNIWFWVAQHPITVAWYVLNRRAFGDGGPGVFYLTQISIAALWLSSLAWWQSTRVEEDALTVPDLIAHTDIEPST